MQSFGIDTSPQSFCHSFITLSMITLFKVSPEIRCSGVKTRCCCYCSFHSTKHLSEFPTGSPRTGVSNRPTGGIYKFCDFLSNLPYSDHFSRPFFLPFEKLSHHTKVSPVNFMLATAAASARSGHLGSGCNQGCHKDFLP